MTEPVIREAANDDIQSILALWHQSEKVQGSFRAIPYSGDPDERLTAIARKVIDDPDAAVLLAELDGRPVAMAFLTLDRPSRMSDELAVDISRMVVDESLRGRGIGPLLVARAEAFARERRARWLQAKIFSDNDAAIRFWEREHFVPVYEQRLRPRIQKLRTLSRVTGHRFATTETVDGLF
jgi:GNAT superfamily N-acetyltransferase